MSGETAHPGEIVRIYNPRTDRHATLKLMSWFDIDKVTAARVLVVGAGALGNEVLKNLALLGVGHIYVMDLDNVEAANLSRSILFREEDNGCPKALVAARRVREIDPAIRAYALVGDLRVDLGLGVLRRMDVVVGCLDSRGIRRALNRFCYRAGKPWVDGAIEELFGRARTWIPEQDACYECTLRNVPEALIEARNRCPQLAMADLQLGKVPTTPVAASIIGAIQAQETLKLIQGLPVEGGRQFMFNGLTNSADEASKEPPWEGCLSHRFYDRVVELPERSVRNTTFRNLLSVAQSDLGTDAYLDLDPDGSARRQLILGLTCKCGNHMELVELEDRAREHGSCSRCGEIMKIEGLEHYVTGRETFADLTLDQVGFPPLEIIPALNAAREWRYYELTGDADDSLGFVTA